jgi:hypothetical protein
MKLFSASVLAVSAVVFFIPSSLAGDCSNRTDVEWHATISSATHVRVDCDDHKGPVGESLGVAQAGTQVRIVERDQYGDYYVVELNGGRGFVYKSFLKDITESPLPQVEASVDGETEKNDESTKTTMNTSSSVFVDLSTDHQYYDQIADLKQRGVISGNAEGKVMADSPVNRVELAKILVESAFDDESISKAPSTENLYSDIDKTAWYVPYLYLAAEKGFMTGDRSDGQGLPTVRPGDAANGAEVAKMIAVALDLDVRAAGPGEPWYEPYMELLTFHGAMPYDTADHVVTRAEMMFMMSVLLNK